MVPLGVPHFQAQKQWEHWPSIFALIVGLAPQDNSQPSLLLVLKVFAFVPGDLQG